jgi:hypothetical protein
MTSAPPTPGGLNRDTDAASRGHTTSPFDAAAEMASLFDRVRKLEAPDREKKGHWYTSELFSSVMSGVILAAFGFFLTGRLEQSAKERELNTTNATEMQGLLLKVTTGSREEAQAAALSLTAFGQYAIPPLVMELDGSPQSQIAAERGLTSMALTNQADICDILAQVLDNRTQRYSAQSHSSVIRVLGVSNCQKAIPVLQRYEGFLKRADADSTGFAEYQRSVRDGLRSNVASAQAALDTALTQLRANHAF